MAPNEAVSVGSGCALERRTHPGRIAVLAGEQHGHLAHASAWIVSEAVEYQGDDVIGTWPAVALLASVAGERMKCPGAHLTVLVRHVREQLGHRCVIEVMIEDDAATDANRCVAMTEAGA